MSSDLLNCIPGTRHNIGVQDVFKDSPLDGPVKDHLTRVYGALAATMLSATVGALTHLKFGLGGTLTQIATVGLFMLLAMDKDLSRANLQRRGGLLLGFGFMKGASIGPLIQLALFIDPSLIVTALLGTTAVFVCFSLSALVAKRRSYLWLGGVLSSGVSTLCVLSLASFFFPSVRSMLFSVNLYAGLVIFCGYVIYDTQVIIENVLRSPHTADYLMDAVQLFIDFVAIFVRLLVILIQQQQKRAQEKERKRKNRR